MNETDTEFFKFLLRVRGVRTKGWLPYPADTRGPFVKAGRALVQWENKVNTLGGSRFLGGWVENTMKCGKEKLAF